MAISILVTSLILLATSLTGVNPLAAQSTGCGKTPSLKSGTNSTITVGNKSREFIVRLPDNYDSKHPYKLVFTFHYLTGTATAVTVGNNGSGPYYGLPALANNSAIFVSPNGQPEAQNTRFPGVMGWANKDGEDIRFIDSMLKAILDDLCVNTDLVFSTGFSYGGAISYAITCAIPKAFRAVAIMSGGTMSGCEGGEAKSPMAYYEQHGTRDSVLNISMARGMRDIMIKNNGCKPVVPEPTAPTGKHTKVVYEGCDPKYPLTWTVFDGEHTPAFKDAGAATSFSPNYVWEFFSQFS